MSNEKSPEFRLMEWLYENNYEHIHQKWFLELGDKSFYDFLLSVWLQSKHPEIWKQYESNDGSLVVKC